MHIPEKRKKSRLLKTVIISALVSAILVVAWLQVRSSLSGAFVELDKVVVSEVTRGDLIRDIRAPGTLVPIQLNFIAASSSGRVEKIYLEAGEVVHADSIIMQLDNPELSQALESAKHGLAVVNAEYYALEQRLRREILNQRAAVTEILARFKMAELRSEANSTLATTGVVSSIEYNESILLAEQLKVQHGIEVERSDSLPALEKAELAAAQARIDMAAGALALQQELADDLIVKAGFKGVLQEVPLEAGEQFMVGTILARVAGQDQLKAELRVQESQVKDVAREQSVVIRAGGKQAKGIVRRIDPAVQEGVVLVDVYFDGAMLEGARPDLRIDGIIELENLSNVLKIRRPVYSQENSINNLFVLNKKGNEAQLQAIEFGSGSVDSIEIRSTLTMGDRVIVSDSSEFNKNPTIKLRN